MNLTRIKICPVSVVEVLKERFDTFTWGKLFVFGYIFSLAVLASTFNRRPFFFFETLLAVPQIQKEDV